MSTHIATSLSSNLMEELCSRDHVPVFSARFICDFFWGAGDLICLKLPFWDVQKETHIELIIQQGRSEKMESIYYCYAF